MSHFEKIAQQNGIPMQPSHKPKADSSVAKHPPRTASQKKPTLCWTCQNAYAHLCGWIADAIPVPGWEAKPTQHTYLSTTEGGKRGRRVYNAARVNKCPNYIKQQQSAQRK